jgi:hypothetical protein
MYSAPAVPEILPGAKIVPGAMDITGRQPVGMQGVTPHIEAPSSAADAGNVCGSFAAVTMAAEAGETVAGPLTGGGGSVDDAPLHTDVVFCGVRGGSIMLPVRLPCEVSEILNRAEIQETFPYATRIIFCGKLVTQLTTDVLRETCVHVV